jgi:hypothetical protein
VTYILPYYPQMEALIEKAYAAIQEAITLIDNQEDGPFTMRCALKVIEECVTLIESEGVYLQARAEDMNAIALKMRDQRDEALNQRDMLVEIIRRYFTDPS